MSHDLEFEEDERMNYYVTHKLSMIEKRLQACKRAEEILEVCESTELTVGELSFAMLRLGQLPPLSNITKKGDTTAKLVKLLENVESHLHEMTHLDLSAHVAWGVSKAGVCGHLPGFMPKLATIVLKRMGELTGYNLSSLAWSFATAQLKNPKLFAEIAIYSKAKLKEMRPQNLANIAWAYAKAGEPAKDLFDAIADECLSRMPTFNEQNIANLSWSFAKANVKHVKLFQSIAASSAPRLSEFKVQGLVNLSWAFSLIGATGPNITKLYQCIAEEVEDRVEDLSARSLITIDRSFKRAEFDYTLARLIEHAEKIENGTYKPMDSRSKSPSPPSKLKDADGWTTIIKNKKQSKTWKDSESSPPTNTSAPVVASSNIINSSTIEIDSDIEKKPHVAALEKTDICRFFKRGKCQYGKDCHFAHGENELLARNNKKIISTIVPQTILIVKQPPPVKAVVKQLIVKQIVPAIEKEAPPVIKKSPSPKTAVIASKKSIVPAPKIITKPIELPIPEEIIPNISPITNDIRSSTSPFDFPLAQSGSVSESASFKNFSYNFSSASPFGSSNDLTKVNSIFDSNQTPMGSSNNLFSNNSSSSALGHNNDATSDRLSALLIGSEINRISSPPLSNPFIRNSFSPIIETGASGSFLNNNSSSCIKCFLQNASHALLPCGHLCVCSNCSRLLIPNESKCPKCGQITSGTLLIRS